MELRQLEYFVAVADEASFTKAAAKLFVAQPGVSAQVRRLERELGQPLFDRSGPTVRLTDVGEAVLGYARAVLDGAAMVRLAVDEFAGLVRGRVAVGMVRACSSVELPPVLADFHQDYPGVEITLSEDDSDRLLGAVISGRLDVAVVALTEEEPDGVALDVIVDEELVIAVSSGDRLAGAGAVGIEALRGRGLVSLPKGTGMRACLERACAAAGFEPRVALEVSNPAMLADLAARGLGPAILPASLAAERAENLTAVRVSGPGLRGRMALAWRAGGPSSPAARRFLDYARAAFAAVEQRV
ncbi:LysR family transcriptional regulator [Actinokineospora iranica]|nr:LysR substrate-binding domain-containing protein [Actinokineospora iranica]